MKFNVQALRDAVESALVEHRRLYDEKVEQDKRNAEQALGEWMERWSEPWQDAATAIMSAWHDGRPVTSDMLPRTNSGWREVATFTAPKPDAPAEYRAPADLLQFKAVLDAITDDEVSSSGLKDLGFQNLRKIAPYMQPKGK